MAGSELETLLSADSMCHWATVMSFLSAEAVSLLSCSSSFLFPDKVCVCVGSNHVRTPVLSLLSQSLYLFLFFLLLAEELLVSNRLSIVAKQQATGGNIRLSRSAWSDPEE